MPALNFKAQFADKVESGEKRQTIRPERKRPIKVGDTLYLYTGMRTKECRKLRTAKCTGVDDIEIDSFSMKINDKHYNRRSHYRQMDVKAHADGFKSWPFMRKFFKEQYGLPFLGVLIRWT